MVQNDLKQEMSSDWHNNSVLLLPTFKAVSNLIQMPWLSLSLQSLLHKAWQSDAVNWKFQIQAQTGRISTLHLKSTKNWAAVLHPYPLRYVKSLWPQQELQALWTQLPPWTMCIRYHAKSSHQYFLHMASVIYGVTWLFQNIKHLSEI